VIENKTQRPHFERLKIAQLDRIVFRVCSAQQQCSRQACGKPNWLLLKPNKAESSLLRSMLPKGEAIIAICLPFTMYENHFI
jgi:hypothetical protein